MFEVCKFTVTGHHALGHHGYAAVTCYRQGSKIYRPTQRFECREESEKGSRSINIRSYKLIYSKDSEKELRFDLQKT